MTDRVYPASKPNPPPSSMNGAPPTTANGGGVGVPPATKPGPFNNNNNNRPPVSRPYRPQQPPPPRRRRCSPRKFCCLCFIYTLIFILSLLLLAAIAACIFYVLYHPKHPTFSVTSVRISAFNLSTDTGTSAFSHLDSHIDFTLSAKNPNKKIHFFYDPLLVSAYAAGLDAGNATSPAFQHVPGNTTVVKAAVVGDPRRDLDSDSAVQLKTDLEKKNGGAFPLSVQVDTKVMVKMGKLKSNKVGIRVTCEGINGSLPKKTTNTTTTGKGKGKKTVTTAKIMPVMAVTTDAKCKVDLRIKIWKFTF